MLRGPRHRLSIHHFGPFTSAMPRRNRDVADRSTASAATASSTISTAPATRCRIPGGSISSGMPISPGNRLRISAADSTPLDERDDAERAGPADRTRPGGAASGTASSRRSAGPRRPPHRRRDGSATRCSPGCRARSSGTPRPPAAAVAQRPSTIRSRAVPATVLEAADQRAGADGQGGGGQREEQDAVRQRDHVVRDRPGHRLHGALAARCSSGDRRDRCRCAHARASRADPRTVACGAARRGGGSCGPGSNSAMVIWIRLSLVENFDGCRTPMTLFKLKRPGQGAGRALWGQYPTHFAGLFPRPVMQLPADGRRWIRRTRSGQPPGVVGLAPGRRGADRP